MSGSPARPTDGVGAWLELARLSNAPTVMTNAMVGGAAALVADPRAGGGSSSAPWKLLALALAMACMYTAGMMLNDRLDVEIDRRERPSRPIPSGRISPAAALNAALALLGAGAIIACAVDRSALPWVLALAAAIVLYDLLHRRAWLGIPLLSCCRALAMAVPAAAMSGRAAITGGPREPWSLLASFAVPLAAYIAIVGLVARREVEARDRARWLGVLLVVPALAPLAALARGLLPPLTEERAFGLAFLAGALVAWLVRSQLFATPLPPRLASRFLPARVRPGGVRVPRAIMAWIGAIALVDAMSLVLLGQPGLALAALGLFFVVTVGHARIAGS